MEWNAAACSLDIGTLEHDFCFDEKVPLVSPHVVVWGCVFNYLASYSVGTLDYVGVRGYCLLTHHCFHYQVLPVALRAAGLVVPAMDKHDLPLWLWLWYLGTRSD